MIIDETLMPPLKPETRLVDLNDLNVCGGSKCFQLGDLDYQPKIFKDIDFDSLEQEINFIQMYNVNKKTGQKLPIPRLVAGFADHDANGKVLYRMPGCNEMNIPADDWGNLLLKIRDRLRGETGIDYNHCVATLFRDEHDSLGFHHDKLIDLDQSSPIISLSFGETRPIVFVSNDSKETVNIALKHGSMLVFGDKYNRRYYHSIPKLVNKVGKRISLSFRVVESKINDDGVVSGKGDRYQTSDYPQSYGKSQKL